MSDPQRWVRGKEGAAHLISGTNREEVGVFAPGKVYSTRCGRRLFDSPYANGPLEVTDYHTVNGLLCKTCHRLRFR